MEIIRIGLSCFRFRGKTSTVISDPYDPNMVGMKLNGAKSDIITISHHHPDHDYQDGVKPRDKQLITLDAPGEYEIQGIHVTGWKSYHDDKEGQERGKNTIFKIEIDEINVVHLGDIGHMLADSLIDEIGEIDVLCIPVGGTYTINYQQANEMVRKIDPRIVIPMHYQEPELNPEVFASLDGVEKFSSEFGPSSIEPKLLVNQGKLPEDTQLVILSPNS